MALPQTVPYLGWAWDDLVFLALAGVLLGSSLMVVLSRNIIRSGLFMVLAFAGLAGFYALMGATLGKRAVGLRVVTRLGVRPGLARSAVRSLLAVVSLGLLGLGALAAFFTRSHRSLHDLLSGTYVIEPP